MNKKRIENNEQPRKDNDSVASDKSDYLEITNEKHNKSYFLFFDRRNNCSQGFDIFDMYLVWQFHPL